MHKKIILSLFPPTYWIILFAGILLSFLPADILPLANLSINLFFFLMFWRLAVIIHESGHLLFGKLAGGKPNRMILGSGHEIHRFQWKGIKVIMNNKSIGGLAMVSFAGRDNLRWRYALYVVGGVLLNVMVAGALYLFTGFNWLFFTGRFGVDFASALIAANALCIINLLPFRVTTMGMKLPSDGLTLLKLPFYNKAKLKTFFNADQLLEAYDHFERKEYEEAFRVYSVYHSENPETFLPLLNMSIIKLRLGQFEKALTVISHLEAKLGDKELLAYRGLIYNCFAWIHLLLGNIDLANQYSALALQAAPRDSNFSGTRGSVLIEKGALDEGINLLLSNMTFDYVNPDTLAASIYLMLAYHKKGETEKRDQHLQFVRKNADHLEADDRFLFERNLERVGFVEVGNV